MEINEDLAKYTNKKESLPELSLISEVAACNFCIKHNSLSFVSFWNRYLIELFLRWCYEVKE